MTTVWLWVVMEDDGREGLLAAGRALMDTERVLTMQPFKLQSMIQLVTTSPLAVPMYQRLADLHAERSGKPVRMIVVDV